ncbi:NAD(P)H-dependent oxidoreductase [Burkholderia ubonensis]|uniref:NADPH-dependent FMN reductase-like domain-containing protein n=1 Tax=Burkholderia ubonensis TaxID=101571 RepID=A0AB74DBD7_9BURK|nr:NAD(P)H-dependent oxidoreductase [Burkholderia ubonensis]PAJ77449.1 hypothetical protein CJO71_27905 [Burkholderia ubonensis]PAJ86964.1 hypothetical protein CJO70_15040 [Burkholderia ubonensis]PAJ93855.1 hypothetical protein CJO69_14835 [Burkholderia ubonensis]PAJ97498.1 hypothetical protein CJO68_28770 [Burkholderia ubonensis]PAK07922.1 hypothetical protein CJO67_11370 [Burkholderia ubonensis]
MDEARFVLQPQFHAEPWFRVFKNFEFTGSLHVGDICLAYDFVRISSWVPYKRGDRRGPGPKRFIEIPEFSAVPQLIHDADVSVVGTAVYKGAYTERFTHMPDLADMSALARKPVIPTATGASPALASEIDYHLRSLCLLFDASIAT